MPRPLPQTCLKLASNSTSNAIFKLALENRAPRAGADSRAAQAGRRPAHAGCAGCQARLRLSACSLRQVAHVGRSLKCASNSQISSDSAGCKVRLAMPRSRENRPPATACKLELPPRREPLLPLRVGTRTRAPLQAMQHVGSMPTGQGGLPPRWVAPAAARGPGGRPPADKVDQGYHGAHPSAPPRKPCCCGLS